MIGVAESKQELRDVLDGTLASIEYALDKTEFRLLYQEAGNILSKDSCIVRVGGLPGVMADELVRLPGGNMGIVFNLDPEEISVVLLDESVSIKAGQKVRRTGMIMQVPVGEELLGRIVDPLGRPLDEQGPIGALELRPVEREAPGIMDRAPVSIPLQTGIQAIDALIPIGRGQRELILGDRQTGKTAIAIDTIINQKGKNVLSVYCAIGQRSSAVAKLIADLRSHDVLKNCIVVVAAGEDSPGLNYIAPYAATTMAEFFMENGRDVLIIYDDLTRHARTYRELSLLLRRPPGREAYPGDIFYIHSRLLERSTHLKQEHGGGSLTAMPIIETQAQNLSAYIPTNLISITDGQIYLSPKLFREGVLPPVDTGNSVSRVGGKTQLPAYREVTGDLRLSYSQFEELETFARFGTRLDEKTLQTLERGRRVREVLKQPQYQPIPVPDQIAVLLAVTEGVFDDCPLNMMDKAKEAVRNTVIEKLPELCSRIQDGENVENSDRDSILSAARHAIESILENQNGTASNIKA